MNSQLPPTAAPFSADYVDFVELSRTLNRMKWKILGVAGVFLVLGVIVAFSTEPIYRGTVTMLLEARPTRAVAVGEVYDPGYQSDEYFETQTELFKSRDLIGKVVDQMHLVDNPEILPKYEDSLLHQFLSGRWLPFVSQAEPPSTIDLAPILREQAIDVVIRRTDVGRNIVCDPTFIKSDKVFVFKVTDA